MPFFIVSLIFQVALVVHVLKTGRNTTWVFILLFAPFVGAIAYFIVELLPELTNSRTAHSARRRFSSVVNPNRDLHEASQNLAVADTVQNALALADEYRGKSRFAEAKELYERCLKGIHADDPHIMLGLAQTQFALSDYAGTVATLDRLKEKNPGHKSAEGHLLYARAQESLGNLDAATHEYEVLTRYYAGPEPVCRLGMLYKSAGKAQEAKALFQRVINESKVAGKHYNTLHKEWVALAQREGS